MLHRLMCGMKQRVLRMVANFSKKEIAVFMIHEVCQPEFANDKDLSISPESFIKFVNSLKGNFNFVFPEELSEKSKNVCAITFDDAYKNIMNEAIPYLVLHHIKFAVFVCPDLIDKKDYLSSEDVCYLNSLSNCSVGFHCKHHIFISSLSKEEFVLEISPADFERSFALKCKCIAYPYGSVYASFRKDLDCVGKYYSYGFSTIDSWFSNRYLEKHRYFLPRININEKTYVKTAKKLNFRLSGGQI